MKIIKPIQALIDEFRRLPTIGPKTAARLTYFLLKAPEERSLQLAEALMNLKRQTVVCSRCFNVAAHNPCEICSDGSRQQDVICVVEEPLDVAAIESTGKFNGVYHVLGGVINPIAGIGPEELRIRELIERLGERSARGGQGDQAIERFEKRSSLSTLLGVNLEGSSSTGTSGVSEIILAMNPTMEGEATAMFIKNQIKSQKLKMQNLKITRLARGLPTGGDLEYADSTTLSRALEGRTVF